MVTKICEQCGEEFEAKRSTAKYCCVSCRKKAKYHKDKPKVEIECVSCGKMFVPTHGSQLYCSDYCKEFEHQELKRLAQHEWHTFDTVEDDEYDY